MYPKGPIADPSILKWIETRRPPYIIINLGGGVQERLGFYLKENLSYRPSIICVGAAVAFLSGIQANIPAWADAWGPRLALSLPSCSEKIHSPLLESTATDLHPEPVPRTLLRNAGGTYGGVNRNEIWLRLCVRDKSYCLKK